MRRHWWERGIDGAEYGPCPDEDPNRLWDEYLEATCDDPVPADAGDDLEAIALAAWEAHIEATLLDRCYTAGGLIRTRPEVIDQGA